MDKSEEQEQNEKKQDLVVSLILMFIITRKYITFFSTQLVQHYIFKTFIFPQGGYVGGTRTK